MRFAQTPASSRTRSSSAYCTVLGVAALDISIDLEDRDLIVGVSADVGECPPIRGAGFLQLATVHGKSVREGKIRTMVDLVITDQDNGAILLPTDLGSIYG